MKAESIFKLGLAAGSFACGDIDQGVHILLPCIDENGNTENEEFESLCENYFIAIPHFDELSEELQENRGMIYFGAVQKFMQAELNLDFGDHAIEFFEKALK